MDLSDPQGTAAELVERIRADRTGAEEELYARYRRGIGMILSQMSASREDAEDLSQETFRLALERSAAAN